MCSAEHLPANYKTSLSPSYNFNIETTLTSELPPLDVNGYPTCVPPSLATPHINLSPSMLRAKPQIPWLDAHLTSNVSPDINIASPSIFLTAPALPSNAPPLPIANSPSALHLTNAPSLPLTNASPSLPLILANAPHSGNAQSHLLFSSSVLPDLLADPLCLANSNDASPSWLLENVSKPATGDGAAPPPLLLAGSPLTSDAHANSNSPLLLNNAPQPLLLPPTDKPLLLNSDIPPFNFTKFTPHLPVDNVLPPLHLNTALPHLYDNNSTAPPLLLGPPECPPILQSAPAHYVLVKTKTGKIIRVQVSLTEKIEDVKKKVQEIAKFSHGQFLLISYLIHFYP